MDFDLPGLRDRRIAAADEFTDGPRQIYMQRRNARGYAARRGAGARLDIRDVAFDREPHEITAIVLHQTSHTPRTAEILRGGPERDSEIRSWSRIDEIIAHFVVLGDGTIVYTRDVQFMLNDAGAQWGIDIEMDGRYSTHETPPEGPGARPPVEQLVAGRRLVSHLVTQIPSIRQIHPHGQIETPDSETGDRQKFHSCCGPDFWMNVGEWAARAHQLATDEVYDYRRNWTISERQRNQSYLRDDVPDPLATGGVP